MALPNYRSWEWKYTEFPVDAPFEQQARFLLSAGILAPSIHNTQPWKFKLGKKSVTVYPDTAAKLPYADPKGNNLLMSLGCCIQNILLAAEANNYSASLDIHANTIESTYATITFKKTKQENSSSKVLASFITKRYSNKLQYNSKSIPPSLMRTLTDNTYGEANISILEQQKQKESIAQYHSLSIKEQYKNKLFFQELHDWLRVNNTTETTGMPAFVIGLSQIQSRILLKLFSYNPMLLGSLAQKKDRKLLLQSPAIGCIHSEEDSFRSWIQCGILFERIALLAIANNLSITFMQAIIESPKYNKHIQELFRLGEKKPQILFRIGYADNKPYHTPRKSIDAFLNK